MHELDMSWGMHMYFCPYLIWKLDENQVPTRATFAALTSINSINSLNFFIFSFAGGVDSFTTACSITNANAVEIKHVVEIEHL